MKVYSTKIDQYLNDINLLKNIILIYGPDQGQVYDILNTLKNIILNDSSDPFSFSELNIKYIKDNEYILKDESVTLSLTGGNRVVQVIDANDTISKEIKNISELKEGNTFFILTSGNLGPRSTLRKLFEKNKNLLSIVCYEDSPYSLEKYIKNILNRDDLKVNNEALSWLINRLGADRKVTKSELEKLLLYKFSDKEKIINLQDVMSCVGHGDNLDYDDLVYAMASGKKQVLKKVYNRLISEGASLISITLFSNRHLFRLYKVICEKETIPLDSLISKLQPPIFFKRKDEFRRQCEIWSLEYLTRSLSILSEVEELVKSSYIPQKEIVERALLQIAGAVSRLEKNYVIRN